MLRKWSDAISLCFDVNSYKDTPGHALRCTFEGTLKELLVYSKPKTPKKIFYQQLSIRINELENKRQFKVTLYLSF
jgi:ubiquitin carboxyl-terminal hydrolase 7